MALVLPVTLVDGTIADAVQVMSDLNTIVNYINALGSGGLVRVGRVAGGGGTITGSLSADGVVIVKNVTTNATVYQLPANPSNQQWVTVKDGSAIAYGFQNYNCKVVTTDGSAIGLVSGTTGVLLRSNGQSQDFVYINSQWWQL
jgi:hypothetical protein